MERHVFATEQETASACAAAIARTLREAVAARRSATLAISGGSTPRLMLRELAAHDMPWHAVHLFWADERMVPPDDEQSNYRMVAEELIRRVDLAESNVHRIAGEIAPAEAATRYADELRLVLGPELVFDVIQLGLGADGHTASLFPGNLLVLDREQIAAAVFAASANQWRVTLCTRVLCSGRHTIFLVSGGGKAHAVRDVFEAKYDPVHVPGQLARDCSAPEWFLDRAAAGVQ